MKNGSFVLALLALVSMQATAGHQECNHHPVADSVRSCPDGSIPMYVAGDLPRPAQAASGTHASATATPDGLYGVWRTRVGGAVWTSPTGYDGTAWLHVGMGVAVGDLIIRPDHTYLWNAWGGKRGRWVQGDADYPVVLIDTAEDRRWRVGFDPHHTGGRDIVVWDGQYYSYDGRR